MSGSLFQTQSAITAKASVSIKKDAVEAAAHVMTGREEAHRSRGTRITTTEKTVEMKEVRRRGIKTENVTARRTINMIKTVVPMNAEMTEVDVTGTETGTETEETETGIEAETARRNTTETKVAAGPNVMTTREKIITLTEKERAIDTGDKHERLIKSLKYLK